MSKTSKTLEKAKRVLKELEDSNPRAVGEKKVSVDLSRYDQILILEALDKMTRQECASFSEYREYKDKHDVDMAIANIEQAGFEYQSRLQALLELYIKIYRAGFDFDCERR